NTIDVDQNGTFPRAALDELGKAGLLGLVSAKEVGGMGEGIRAAPLVVVRIAQECASAALVVWMLHAATASIVAHGAREMRAHTPGLEIPANFNGLGRRGNASSPVNADVVLVERASMLGNDGDGFNIMMGIVLPYFSVMNAAMSIGTMNAATTRAAAHVTGTK